ncbi:MAG: hypothetical protein JXR51_04190 [Bacteroidales bacterium]|nr:hypothetical protein [Bacteroidales bacterium]MBN2756356.1 hypothetical protein [Bacteroidales bacterium]
MIAKLSYIFDNQKSNNWISLSVFVKQNNIYLKVGNNVELFSSKENSENPYKNLEMWGTAEVFNQFVADFEDLSEKYSDFSYANKPKNGFYMKKDKQIFEQYFQISTQNIEYLYTSRFINKLSDFIIDFMLQSYKMLNADWRAK